MKARKGKPASRKGVVGELGGTKEEGAQGEEGRHAEAIAASTMRPVWGGAAEDKGQHRCKGRTENSLSLSVPCSI